MKPADETKKPGAPGAAPSLPEGTMEDVSGGVIPGQAEAIQALDEKLFGARKGK
ncbi:MAG: hypothetical protein IK082_06580 [Oscillospiraceae bacterium]|nr:hypothetical protein [Oscillospiraceae bacterium]